jgi:hypothetical protein
MTAIIFFTFISFHGQVKYFHPPFSGARQSFSPDWGG